ncbi:MAG TPA: Holliday junction branch migration protein RuvA [Clostridiaceae bacterium]|jgi:Holliday junction DNA helicase RuvA|nr:Holliday junction branch migration protein RuvA [Clostridiaceae bacterium]
MIASIQGRIVRKSEEHVIIEQGGIGYRLDIAPSAVSSLPPAGETVKLYTYLHVRENEIGLFGFTTEDQKNLFELLQTVSGVGPRLALQVVDTLSPDAFALAILQNDIDKLTQVKGIGKKGAARMVLELTDKLKKSAIAVPDIVAKAAPAEGAAENEVSEVIAALMVLGYSSSEAHDAVKRARPVEEDTVETLLRRALGQLAIV